MNQPGDRLVVPVSSRDHARGPAGARLHLVEYGDLRCGHCALLHPILRDIAAELDDSLLIIFRHYLLDPGKTRAAEAVESAAAQGRFWEMLDLLYEEKADLEGDLSRIARKCGLDVKQFTRDLERQTHRDRVRADYLGGVRGGVKGTPAIFINEVRYRGPLQFDAIVTALLQASRAVNSASSGYPAAPSGS
jgi:formate-nitrite transporter family protein